MDGATHLVESPRIWRKHAAYPQQPSLQIPPPRHVNGGRRCLPPTMPFRQSTLVTKGGPNLIHAKQNLATRRSPKPPRSNPLRVVATRSLQSTHASGGRKLLITTKEFQRLPCGSCEKCMAFKGCTRHLWMRKVSKLLYGLETKHEGHRVRALASSLQKSRFKVLTKPLLQFVRKQR